MTTTRSVVAHPFLLPLYSVLAFYAHNIGEMSLTDLAPIAVAVCGGSILLFALSWIVLRDGPKAGLVATTIILIVLFYGHIFQTLHALSGDQLRHGFVFPLLTLLLFCAALLLTRRPILRNNANTVLNWATAALVLIPLASIVQHHRLSTDIDARIAEDEELGLVSPPERRPHVFFLIFDRYAANRTLRYLHRFDNRAFEEFLGRRGFFVATDSYANYLKTAQSLAATFDMRYLDALAEDVWSGSSDLYHVLPMLTGRHRVLGVFKRMGYRYVHMGSWWQPTRRHSESDDSYNLSSIFSSSEAVSAYSRGTVQPLVYRQLMPLLNIDTSDLGEQCRRVPFQFEALKSIADDSDPTFVFAHFLVPHDPFVFDDDGRCMGEAEADQRGYNENYIGQVKYINSKIRELVDVLLAQENKPIIIIQADEGPFPERYREDEWNFNWRRASRAELRTKFRILNAMYFPGGRNDELHRSITPVNTFRVVFNDILGVDLPLLEDRSYAFVDYYHPFDFFEVTETVR
jgi:hypothetical protein